MKFYRIIGIESTCFLDEELDRWRYYPEEVDAIRVPFKTFESAKKKLERIKYNKDKEFESENDGEVNVIQSEIFDTEYVFEVEYLYDGFKVKTKYYIVELYF